MGGQQEFQQVVQELQSCLCEAISVVPQLDICRGNQVEMGPAGLISAHRELDPRHAWCKKWSSTRTYTHHTSSWLALGGDPPHRPPCFHSAAAVDSRRWMCLILGALQRVAMRRRCSQLWMGMEVTPCCGDSAWVPGAYRIAPGTEWSVSTAKYNQSVMRV
jgi:hypothetical protein